MDTKFSITHPKSTKPYISFNLYGKKIRTCNDRIKDLCKKYDFSLDYSYKKD